MKKNSSITGRQTGELARLLEERGVDSANFQKNLLENSKNLEELVQILLGQPTEAAIIDNTQQVSQKIYFDFEKLFDTQIATLKDRGTPEQIIEILQNQKGSVLKRASKMTFGDGNIPFLPVIPRTIRGLYDFMAMVRNGGKVGYTDLNPTQISDVVDTPQEPYYIYDVEDGSSTRGKSPENAEKIFRQQKRSPLTAAEVMALTTHTDVLSKHYMWATGSRYESASGVPVVYLGRGGSWPGLSWGYLAYSDDHWGSASCGSR